MDHRWEGAEAQYRNFREWHGSAVLSSSLPLFHPKQIQFGPCDFLFAFVQPYSTPISSFSHPLIIVSFPLLTKPFMIVVLLAHAFGTYFTEIQGNPHD